MVEKFNQFLNELLMIGCVVFRILDDVSPWVETFKQNDRAMFDDVCVIFKDF